MVICAHILRVLAGFALLFQLALPLAQAQAAANGTDLASLICNPSGRTISPEAKATLSELLAAVGDTEQTERAPECDRCVTPNVTITTLTATITAPISYTRVASQRPRLETLGPITVRGPPCGTRAPPIFV